LKKWIVPSFFTDGRSWSMPGQHQGFVRQGKHLFANAADQQLMIGSWEICAADAPGEKYIAVEDNLVAGGVEAKAPGAMTRNKKNTKGYAANVYSRRLPDQKIGLYRFSFQEKASLFEKIRIGHERNTVFVKSDLAFACPLDFGRVIEMVRVTVRQQQHIESYAQIPDPIRRPGGSINQYISSRRPDQVSVGVENTANKSLKVEHSE
jgi:hypothetical protein